MPGGGDTETLNYKLGYFYDYNLNISVGYTRINKGEIRWGEWDQPLSYKVENKIFLRGTVEKSNLYYAELSYRYNKYISADIYYSHNDIINYNHNLPAYDDSWQEEYSEINSDPDPDNDYTDYQDYYEKEIEPAKKYQVYSNNTFRLTLNIIFKNYFSGYFKGEDE